MAVIKVQKIPKKPGASAEDILTLFLYYFPQFTLKQARELPFRRVSRMIKVVERERAKNWYYLSVISGSAGTKKHKEVIKYFQKLMEK